MNIVVFVEGGLVTSVVDLDAKFPHRGIDYEMLDYDVLEDASTEDVRDYWKRRSPALLEYMQNNLPEEYEEFVEATK